MTVALGARSRRGAAAAGTVLATVSAVSFGSSGPMAKALLESGWSAGAAALTRLAGAALVLTVVAAVTNRGGWRLRASSARVVVVYGIVAMAGTQLAFFNAVRTLDVGVALLLEYLAPILLLAWVSLRTRTWPRLATMLGAAAAGVGLAFVLDIGNAGSVDLAGVAWGLLAALCLGAYFILSDRRDEGLPPLIMAAAGTAVGAVVIAMAGVTGLVPLRFSGVDVVLANIQLTWVVPALWLIVVSTAVAYVTGIAAILRLGARPASFLALGEVLFAVLVAWALLAELPRPAQLVGGLCIVTGIVIVQRAERPRAPSADAS